MEIVELGSVAADTKQDFDTQGPDSPGIFRKYVGL